MKRGSFHEPFAAVQMASFPNRDQYVDTCGMRSVIAILRDSCWNGVPTLTIPPFSFLFRPKQDAEAAKCFFEKALEASVFQTSLAEERTMQLGSQASRSVPRVINVNKNVAYPKAIVELKASGIPPDSVELRQVKYLSSLIE